MWAGWLQVGGGSSDAAPPATPTAAVLTQQPPAPSSATPAQAPTPATAPDTATAAPAQPAYVTDLNARGADWVEGTWSLGHQRYAHSLAWSFPCIDDPQYLTVDLGGGYQRFTATVGVDDRADSDSYTQPGFEVYADRDDDGVPESDELVASRGAVVGNPGHIDAPISGAPRIILLIRPPRGDCLTGPAVWGTPQVS